MIPPLLRRIGILELVAVDDEGGGRPGVALTLRPDLGRTPDQIGFVVEIGHGGQVAPDVVGELADGEFVEQHAAPAQPVGLQIRRRRVERPTAGTDGEQGPVPVERGAGWVHARNVNRRNIGIGWDVERIGGEDDVADFRVVVPLVDPSRETEAVASRLHEGHPMRALPEEPRGPIGGRGRRVDTAAVMRFREHLLEKLEFRRHVERQGIAGWRGGNDQLESLVLALPVVVARPQPVIAVAGDLHRGVGLVPVVVAAGTAQHVGAVHLLGAPLGIIRNQRRRLDPGVRVGGGAAGLLERAGRWRVGRCPREEMPHDRLAVGKERPRKLVRFVVGAGHGDSRRNRSCRGAGKKRHRRQAAPYHPFVQGVVMHSTALDCDRRPSPHLTRRLSADGRR
ncbi:MAG: hypothetical protein GX590_10555 [Lentisphaerae bacterium]|nr:hypothetical protein [Lentisphaerota bacterium]